MRFFPPIFTSLTVLCGVGCGADPAPGPVWSEVPSLSEAPWLLNVTARPDGQRWVAVGGTPEQGVLWEEQDGAWQEQSIPSVPLLNWVQWFQQDQGFAVGREGSVLFFDGQQWQAQETPTEQDLWGVWGATPDNVWAVGGAGRAEGQATLLHFDGSAWSEVPTPALARPNVWAWFKVWGRAADDVFVVGQRGAILHYDGQLWEEQGAGTGEDLISLWGADEGPIVAVGGRSNGVVAWFDGSGWDSRSLSPMPGLNGVWTPDGDTVFVAGLDGTLARLKLSNGEQQDDSVLTTRTFHAIHGALGRVVSVGGNLAATQAPYQGLAWERRWEP